MVEGVAFPQCVLDIPTLEHNSSGPNPGSLPSHGHHAGALIPHHWLHFITESCQWIGLLCIATSPVLFLNYIQPQNGKGFYCFVLAVVGVGTCMVPVCIWDEGVFSDL